MNHSRLEQYLDEVSRPLTPLGETARREWREEARQHLDDLVAAHAELGASENEAIEAALHQFGDAAKIGRAVRRESVYFWQRTAFWRALLIPASGLCGGALLVSAADHLLPRLDFLDGPSGQTIMAYFLLGAAASVFAVAGKRRLAWPFAGACVAALAGPVIARFVDPLMCRVLGASIGSHQMDPIQVFCHAVPVGASVWMRQIAPRRAACGASLAYLTTLGATCTFFLARRLGTPDALVGWHVPLIATMFWALQGALLGGFLGVTRRALGRVVKKVRPRFEQAGRPADLAAR